VALNCYSRWGRGGLWWIEVRGGMVSIGLMFGCWSKLIVLHVQSSCVMVIIVVQK
jgi:hypothetical protein